MMAHGESRFVAAGSSAHATGVPGSNDKYLPIYGVLLFAIGTLASWPASNNAAIFADVSPQPSFHTPLHPAAC